MTATAHVSASAALAAQWHAAGLPPDALSAIRLTGAEPVLPSSFAVGTAAQSSIGASALIAAELWALRNGKRQQVCVDMRHAAIEFRSERYLRIDGEPARESVDKIAGLFRCGASGWVRIHAGFAHHRDRALALLECAHERSAVAHALRAWPPEAFEAAAAQAGAAVSALRSFDEWDRHPQGQAVSALPLIAIERIGDAPREPLPPGERPLSGVRVLDLTRVIAGPVCGRTLAAHGADVLLVTAEHLPAMYPYVIDTGRGKLSTSIDLREATGQQWLARLLSNADVFVQGYRPGSLHDKGFGPHAAARIRPGIVYVSLCAYGNVGPWSGRRGFDSLVQTACGFNLAEAQAAGTDQPKVLPAQALDHASGYWMAFGAMVGLHRRALEGGSWQVQVSLASTGNWLRSLGRVEQGWTCPDPRAEDIADLLEESDSGYGRLSAVRHAAQLSDTPARWVRPAVRLGTHPAQWPS